MTAPTPEAIAALVSRLRGIYPVGPGNPPEFGVRTFDNLPPIQAEAADTILALLSELEAAQKQIADWHDEVARFNRGYERRAEPYSALEDEFEQMGYAWANFDKLRAELEAARWERDELRSWLCWRAAWTGADGPKNKDGVPWWRSALNRETPPKGF